MRTSTRTRALAIAALLALALSACGGDDDMEMSADTAGGGGDQGAIGVDEDLQRESGRSRGLVADTSTTTSYSADAGTGGGATYGTSLPSSDLPAIGPSVIKTADIELEVGEDELDDALQDAIGIATRAEGFVVSSSVRDEERGRATLVVRVPVDRFELVLREVGALGKVTNEGVSGEDVSQEFVDLEARLRNAQTQETVLLRLMERSQTIADTIRVQRELQGLQLDIEQLKGRIRYLEDRAALSTVGISFIEKGAPVAKDPGTLDRAWQTASETFLAVVSAVVIGAAFALPVGLVGAIAYLLVALILRRLRPRLQP